MLRKIKPIACNFAFTIILRDQLMQDIQRLRVSKIFTRIAVHKHIKLHDTSEYTTNVARERRRRRDPRPQFCLFHFVCHRENPVAPASKSDIIVNIDLRLWAKWYSDTEQCRYNYMWISPMYRQHLSVYLRIRVYAYTRRRGINLGK